MRSLAHSNATPTARPLKAVATMNRWCRVVVVEFHPPSVDPVDEWGHAAVALATAVLEVRRH